jgi:RecB family exonuclease
METVAPAGVPTGPVTGDQLMSVVDERWSELSTAFEAEWQSTTEKRRAAKLSAAIAAYLSNFDAAGSTLLSNEGGFNLVLDFDDERDADPRDASRGPIRLTVSGKIDRVEAEADGSVVIADLKTGSAASFKVKELPQNGHRMPRLAAPSSSSRPRRMPRRPIPNAGRPRATRNSLTPPLRGYAKPREAWPVRRSLAASSSRRSRASFRAGMSTASTWSRR